MAMGMAGGEDPDLDAPGILLRPGAQLSCVPAFLVSFTTAYSTTYCTARSASGFSKKRPRSMFVAVGLCTFRNQ